MEPIMVQTEYLTVLIVMSVFLIGVVLCILRFWQWRTCTRTPANIPLVQSKSGAISLDEMDTSVTWYQNITVVAYVAVVIVLFSTTLATLYGKITEQMFLTGLGTELGIFFIVGVAVTDNFRVGIVHVAYRLKRSVLFRKNPLWSQLIGWMTFLSVLIILGVIFVATWYIIGGGGLAFIVALTVIGFIVITYASSAVRKSRTR